MKVFAPLPHNRPSGGTKYVNLLVNLFIEKGFQGYVVLAGETETASFLNSPAPVINIKRMLQLCSEEDIIIDVWPQEDLWSASRAAPAKQKIFWSHGASMPIGKGYVGEKAFSGSFHTQFWNTSRACVDYIRDEYGVESHVLPLFSPADPDALFSSGRPYDERDGILVLWARGAWRIPKVFSRVSARTVTVVFSGYNESEWYDLLFRHRIFVSVDQGIASTPLRRRLKYRIFGKDSNYWKTPPSRLLGFPTPPFEAALCGCVVVGAAMGGGLEWMREDNCFLAEDLNLDSLIEQTERAVNADDDQLESIAQAAFQSVSRFTKENTWNRLRDLLGL